MYVEFTERVTRCVGQVNVVEALLGNHRSVPVTHCLYVIADMACTQRGGLQQPVTFSGHPKPRPGFTAHRLIGTGAE
jgi:hypothetical protein